MHRTGVNEMPETNETSSSETDADLGNSNSFSDLLGCEVDFYDDKKERWQSHEAKISKAADATLLNGYGSLEATGYGATKEEAFEDLKKVVTSLVAT
jgi:hypothetical protein